MTVPRASFVRDVRSGEEGPGVAPGGMNALPPIPEEEYRRLEAALLAPPHRVLPSLVPLLREYGVEPVGDPHSPRIADAAIAALRDSRPFSVIRLGDGEFNLIAYGRYPGMPTLDRNGVESSLDMYEDRFAPNEAWTVSIRELLLGAVQQADIVGTTGLEPRTDPQPTPEAFVAHHLQKMRREAGRTVWRAGVLRGHRITLELARQGAFQDRLVASALLYFGVIANLDRLLAAARRVVLITKRTELLDRARRRSPGAGVDLIEVGRTDEKTRVSGVSPHFLREVEQQLPQDLSGALVLIGAGAWAEIYCSWVKQRGGVAIDIGSGFDLLAGDAVRQHQHRLSEEERQSYRL